MKKLNRFFSIFVSLLFIFSSTNCSLTNRTKSFRAGFTRQAEAKGYTEEQKLASLYRAYRDYFTKKNEDGSLVVLYSRLPLSEVTKQYDEYLAVLSDFLEYKDTLMNRYTKVHNLRKFFEHEEEIFQVGRARIRAAELKYVFEQMMGTISYSRAYRDEFGYDERAGYRPSILMATDLSKEFPFQSELIEQAKALGTIKPIEKFELKRYIQFYEKEPDPNSPYDLNKFVWKSKEFNLEVVKYKILVEGETPKENYGNYLEAYRITDGKKEEAPAIRAFLDGRGGIAVAVIDTDRKGDIGFGLPDFVESVSEKELMDDKMISRIFPDKEKHRRIPPKEPEVRLEIVKYGEPIDLWETSTDPRGWTVPLLYKAWDEENYNIKLVFKDKENHKHNSFKKEKTLAFIAKEWTKNGESRIPSVGAVVEYYKPKPPYNETYRDIRVDYYSDTKKLIFVDKNGIEKSLIVTPGSSQVLEEKPFGIAYTFGEKRYVIKDEDGDGKFEKRKETTISESTGNYYEKSKNPFE